MYQEILSESWVYQELAQKYEERGVARALLLAAVED